MGIRWSATVGCAGLLAVLWLPSCKSQETAEQIKPAEKAKQAKPAASQGPTPEQLAEAEKKCSELGDYAAKKFYVAAQQQEARQTLVDIARAASAVYDRSHRLCPSASRWVPSDPAKIRGVNYTPSRAEQDVER